MITYHPIIQQLESALFDVCNLSVEVLRLDLIHPDISGNKWFKLKRNLQKALSEGHQTIVTFGGAFSNHIAATAVACKLNHINCVGIIRGERNEILNETLILAEKNGMLLDFVSREFYDQKHTEPFQNYLTEKFGAHYLIPEGGNNVDGIFGCTEILKPEWNYDVVFCAVGTAATYTGLVISGKPTQKTIGISVLKGENKLPDETNALIRKIDSNKFDTVYGNEESQKPKIENSCIINDYAFKGYAKYDPVLIKFKTEFESEFKIPLDHVYTTKLFYAVFDLIRQSKLTKDSRILVIHSGGLQGNSGFEQRYNITENLL